MRPARRRLTAREVDGPRREGTHSMCGYPYRRPPAPGPESWRTMATFLIVDDHPRFRALVSVLLREEGHDVVGLDVHRPDISGFEAASRIAGQDGAPTVWLTSTHDGSDYEEMARRNGARGFVPK